MDYRLALAVLAYLYPPGRTADDRWEVRWEAAKVIRRAVRSASALPLAVDVRTGYCASGHPYERGSAMIDTRSVREAGPLEPLPGRHGPSGHYVSLVDGGGGPSRHECIGCAAPITHERGEWRNALTGSMWCPTGAR